MAKYEYIEGKQAAENFEQGMKALFKVPKDGRWPTQAGLWLEWGSSDFVDNPRKNQESHPRGPDFAPPNLSTAPL
jgi:hypothetical protein